MADEQEYSLFVIESHLIEEGPKERVFSSSKSQWQQVHHLHFHHNCTDIPHITVLGNKQETLEFYIPALYEWTTPIHK